MLVDTEVGKCNVWVPQIVAAARLETGRLTESVDRCRRIGKQLNPALRGVHVNVQSIISGTARDPIDDLRYLAHIRVTQPL